MVEATKTIAESKNFIVLDRHESDWGAATGYQSETDLENELIRDLQDQGYEFLSTLITPQDMLANVRCRCRR
jgi:type I restriction enzyme, R subunit